jgi:chromosome segregation ATPase
MAASQDQTDGDLAQSYGQMIQRLMKQQAEAEEAFSYQIRDLQKHIIGVRKQRANDAEHYQEEIDSLRKQLASADLRSEGLQGRLQQLTKDIRTSATDAATDVLDQYNKTAERMPKCQFNELEEKIGQVDKAVADLKRDMTTQQDDMDVQLESLGSRLRQLKEDIYAINQEAVAKAVAESDLKGGSVVKMRGHLDEVEGHVKNMEKTSASLSERLESLERDVHRCKTTFYYFNEATKSHVERKSR